MAALNSSEWNSDESQPDSNQDNYTSGSNIDENSFDGRQVINDAREGGIRDSMDNGDTANDDLKNAGPDSVEGPNETPEEEESRNEDSGYPNETEMERPEEGNDASFSEQTDVTPPNQREFPSVGNAETDFVSRNHGRTTGRMVGHEPGTENNL